MFPLFCLEEVIGMLDLNDFIIRTVLVLGHCRVQRVDRRVRRARRARQSTIHGEGIGLEVMGVATRHWKLWL